MRIIGVEEHFHTDKYIAHLHSRKDVPYRDIIEEGGEKLERDWYTPTDYFLVRANHRRGLVDLGEGRLKDMDEDGIDMQVLSLYYPGVGQFDLKEGTLWAKNINDDLSEAIKRYPKRFAGFATIAPQDPDAAANELERAVKQLGFKGVMVTGHTRGEYIDGEKYWVIFEMAEKLGVPIYIHPGIPPPNMREPYLAYPGLAQAMWGFGADAGLQAIRLICSGVFEKYPGLKIILGHLGEAIPFWLWRIDMDIRRPLVKKPPKYRSEYFKDNFYVTTSGMFWPPVLQFVLSTLGADRVMFGTDYSGGSSKDDVQCIESLPISDNDKEKIFHLNAEKLFGL